MVIQFYRVKSLFRLVSTPGWHNYPWQWRGCLALEDILNCISVQTSHTNNDLPKKKSVLGYQPGSCNSTWFTKVEYFSTAGLKATVRIVLALGSPNTLAANLCHANGSVRGLTKAHFNWDTKCEFAMGIQSWALKFDSGELYHRVCHLSLGW